MRRIGLLLIAMLALSTSVIFAQGSEEVSSENAGEKEMKDITVAYVCSDLGNEIFAMQVKSMAKYSKEIGINFVYKACETTGDKITACENYISAGVDTIIVHVSDAPSMESVMKQAQAQGIKFFAYDATVEGADAFYGWKNYDLGYAIGLNAAQWVKDTFDENETVNAASCNFPEYNFLVEREQGYIEALQAECPNVEFVIQGIGGYTNYGVTSGENFLQSGKDINLVVGINDGGCLGVLEAFNAANYGGDKVGIFGCDATNDALTAIKNGGIYRGTVTTDLISLADDFIDIAVDMAKGGEGGEFYGPVKPITIDNVDDYLN